MRCEICDYDDVTGESSYSDITGYVDTHNRHRGHRFNRQGNPRYTRGGGRVTQDPNTGQYLCTICRAVSYETVKEQEFFDIDEELLYTDPTEGELDGQEDRAHDEEGPEWEPPLKDEV